MASPFKTFAIAAAAASLAVVGLGATAAGAQVVVLNARGPSSPLYPQGQVLPPNRLIALRAGDQLEVLDSAGSHVINGPAILTAAQMGVGSQAALKDIFRRANSSRPGIAAVRGFTLEGDAPPTTVPVNIPLWKLDVPAWQAEEPTDAHNFCVVQGQIPVLTRNVADTEARLEIYRDATQTTRAVTWHAGVTDLPWPDGLTAAEGDSYSLNLSATGATRVHWRIVPRSAGSLVDLAKTLLDKGCYDQLDTLQSQVASQ